MDEAEFFAALERFLASCDNPLFAAHPGGYITHLVTRWQTNRSHCDGAILESMILYEANNRPDDVPPLEDTVCSSCLRSFLEKQ